MPLMHTKIAIFATKQILVDNVHSILNTAQVYILHERDQHRWQKITANSYDIYEMKLFFGKKRVATSFANALLLA